jgi:hypothetical protein
VADDIRDLRSAHKIVIVRFVLLLVMLGAVSVATIGCVPIPHRFVHSPALQFFVMDTVGGPINGAMTHFYSSDHSDDRMHTGGSYPTNAYGDAELGGHTDWHPVWWLIPGVSNSRHFAWCVSAPGFERATGRLQSGRADTIRVRLAPSAGAPACPGSVQTFEEIAPRNAPSSRIAFTPESSDIIVKITGCVVDESQGGPIAGASVRLLHSPSSAGSGVIGRFTLFVSPANLPDTLVISRAGYIDYRRAVPEMRSGRLRIGDVRLRSAGENNSNTRASQEDRDLVARCREAS